MYGWNDQPQKQKSADQCNLANDLVFKHMYINALSANNIDLQHKYCEFSDCSTATEGHVFSCYSERAPCEQCECVCVAGVVRLRSCMRTSVDHCLLNEDYSNIEKYFFNIHPDALRWAALLKGEIKIGISWEKNAIFHGLGGNPENPDYTSRPAFFNF
jgi:hypothetical protein